MNPEVSANADDEMRAEYDLSGGVRGKYYERYKQGTNVVLLDPDVAEVFHDSESVNHILRVFMDLAKEQIPKPTGKIQEANKGLKRTGEPRR
jgi:hypothetical protein